MLPIKKTVSASLNLVFDLCGELVREITCHRVSGPAFDGLIQPVQQISTVLGLVSNYASSDIDGTVIKVGDEKILIRTAELPADTILGPDDYIVESGSLVQRHVQAARVDSTQQLWVLQTRRNTPEDRGDLISPLTSQEDYGSLAAATVTEDWQTIN